MTSWSDDVVVWWRGNLVPSDCVDDIVVTSNIFLYYIRFNFEICLFNLSNESLLELFRSQSKVVSDKNDIPIHIKVINQAGRRIVPNYIDFNLIENKD